MLERAKNGPFIILLRLTADNFTCNEENPQSVLGSNGFLGEKRSMIFTALLHYRNHFGTMPRDQELLLFAQCHQRTVARQLGLLITLEVRCAVELV